MKRGNYVGTEAGGACWRRYRESGFFARGNGEFTMHEGGAEFRRLLTKTPMAIRWEEMTGADLGKWHAGRYLGGRSILKVSFIRDNQDLMAGFYLGADWPQMEQLVADLRRRISAS